MTTKHLLWKTVCYEIETRPDGGHKSKSIWSSEFKSHPDAETFKFYQSKVQVLHLTRIITRLRVIFKDEKEFHDRIGALRFVSEGLELSHLLGDYPNVSISRSDSKYLTELQLKPILDFLHNTKTEYTYE